MDGAPENVSSRRGFLKGLAVAGTAVAAPFGLADRAEAGPEKGVSVFRLRSRKTVSCKSCKIHHRFLIFLTREAADQHRAHPGCDCPIVLQKLSKGKFKSLFVKTGALDRGFVDLRTLRRV